MPSMKTEISRLDESWESKGNAMCNRPFDLCDSLTSAEELIKKCGEASSSAGIGGVSYSAYGEEKFEKYSMALGKMNEYVMYIRYQIESLVDEPLYKSFNKKAAETLSRIHLEDYETENIIHLQENWSAAGGGYSYSGTKDREKLKFEDFLGSGMDKAEGNAYSMTIRKECVKEFADLFQQDYEAGKDAMPEGIEDLNDYLDAIVSTGEYDHKMDQPFKSFLSGLLDITIIKPVIEMCTGEDMITGEDLTDFERGMKGVFAVVDIFTLGTAIAVTKVTELGLKEGVKLLGKTVMIQIVSDSAAYTVGYISNELDLPLGVTLLLSMGTGITVSYQAGKLLFKNSADEVIGEAKIISEADRVKIDNWKFTPDDNLYLEYKSVYDNPKYFNQITGDPIYPGTNGNKHVGGFTDGKYTIETLSQGKIIDRYGNNGTGKYFSPDGASFEERALPPFMKSQQYSRYEVKVPFEVKSGSIASWFDQPGGGIQFLTEYSVDELLDLGWIKEIK